MNNIWEHLRDESTPQCVKDYIRKFCAWKSTEGRNTTAHIRWQSVVTLFYPTRHEERLIHRYSLKEIEGGLTLHADQPIADGFYAFTLKVYDGSGYLMQTDLYNAERVCERKLVEWGHGISIICNHLLSKARSSPVITPLAVCLSCEPARI